MEEQKDKNQLSKRDKVNYIDIFATVFLALLLFLFPILFLPFATEPFGIAKQLLLAVNVLILLLLFAARIVSEGRVRLSRTPFDLPIVLFVLFIILSSLFAVNRSDSLMSSVPLVFAALSYFMLVNFGKRRFAGNTLLISYTLGASLACLFVILNYFKLYILPFEFVKLPFFSPIGSLLDQAIYFAFLLPVAIISFRSLILRFQAKEEKNSAETVTKTLTFLLSLILVLSGLFLTIGNLIKLKPALLPYQTGFQTAFAAVSQDPNRTIPGFLLGSGFGTYAVDFTRFKQPTFNQYDNLWSLTFIRSSSFVLELLPTTGILGILSFFFLMFACIKQARKTLTTNPLSITLIIVFLISFFLPLSFVSQTALFFVLGLFSIMQRPLNRDEFFDIELRFMALKNGIQWQQVASTESTTSSSSSKNALPVLWFIATIIIVGVSSYFAYRYFASDVAFQESLVAASKNKGLETYNNQISAIQLFPYRDSFHRIYSQTNLALANSLASSIQKQNASPSAQLQQTIATLIQQSISSGRNATTLSPLASINWQNLASIYRSLIGFGQNAESFAVVAQQQAVLLDPNNPQQYLALGGIYFQLNQWDNAIRQFQIAAALKPDFANAYYNLGHALEAKGELALALEQYRRVQSLIQNNKENSDKIAKEVEVLQKKVGSQSNQANQNPAIKPSQSSLNQPLEISTPSAQLPKRQKPIKIPPPTTATESAR